MLAAEHSPLFVEDVMSSSLRVTAPESPIAVATEDMTKFRFRCLPVVSNDVLFGIITATDIMRDPGSREVFARLTTGNIAEVMALSVRTLMAGARFLPPPPRKRLSTRRPGRCSRKNIGALPLFENSRLIGLVTEFDLVRAFSEE